MEDEDEGCNVWFKEDDNLAAPPFYDWNNVVVFVQFLKVFYNISLRFSGSLYVTSNAIFHDNAMV